MKHRTNREPTKKWHSWKRFYSLSWVGSFCLNFRWLSIPAKPIPKRDETEISWILKRIALSEGQGEWKTLPRFKGFVWYETVNIYTGQGVWKRPDTSEFKKFIEHIAYLCVKGEKIHTQGFEALNWCRVMRRPGSGYPSNWLLHGVAGTAIAYGREQRIRTRKRRWVLRVPASIENRMFLLVLRNSKFEYRNSKQIQMTENQNSKPYDLKRPILESQSRELPPCALCLSGEMKCLFFLDSGLHRNDGKWWFPAFYEFVKIVIALLNESI
jgi:hypothetical protein